MVVLIYILIFLAVEFLSPALVGLLACLPPLRRAARASRWSRWVLVSLLGLLSFAIILAWNAWIASRVMVFIGALTQIHPYGDPAVPEHPPWQEWDDNQQAIYTELFLRNLAPWLRVCYSPIQVVCRAADYINYYVPSSTAWKASFLFGLAALLISAGLAWRLTRPAPVEAQAGFDPGFDTPGAGG